jgi:hypothetical protein
MYTLVDALHQNSFLFSIGNRQFSVKAEEETHYT